MADGVSKKIHINKNDSLEAVLKQLAKVKNTNVIIYIPRGASLVKEASELLELYNQAKSLGKEISIESVDDEILAMASLVGIRAGNSFYSQPARRVVDILPRKMVKAPVLAENYGPADKGEEAGEEPEEPGEIGPEPRRKKRGTAGKRFVKLIVALALLGAAAYYCVEILPSAAVTLNFQQTPWNFTGELAVATNQAQISVGSNQVTIPGKLFTENKTMTQVFPATGSKYVQTYATGTVVIYNNFNTRPQTLVKTTRLVNADGIIFRLDKTITVPGGTMSGGTLVPSQITVSVTADQPGSQYNLAAGQTFHFAGFAGTPRYQGFYAKSTQAMSGGFIGQASVPTQSDIAQATSSIASALQNAITSEIALQNTGEKLISGSSSFQVTKYDIADIPNSSGQFAVTAYGSYQAIGFSENDLVTAMASQLADTSKINLQVKKYSVTYGTPQIDWKHDTMTVPITFQSVWEPAFDLAAFRQKIAGLSQNQLRQAIVAIQGLQSSQIKFWPFWVSRVPANQSKITIDTN